MREANVEVEQWRGTSPALTRREGDLLIHTSASLGLQASRLEDMLASCGAADGVRLVVLRHLDIVVALRCRG